MKIYITWPAGSGKSTLAQQLSKKLRIPVIHLDELLWKIDWTENPHYKKLQEEAIQRPSWIIEWPSCSIIQSMPNVDTIIILDYPPFWNIWRILLRRLKSFLGRKRIGMILLDTLSIEFIRKTLTWRKRQLPRLLENIKKAWLSNRLIILRSFQKHPKLEFKPGKSSIP